MIDALFILALLFGFFAAWHGSRIAWALIASAGLTSALPLVGVPYDFGLWVMIDVAVITAVERGGAGRIEYAAFALFPPAWALSHAKPAGWEDVVNMIVALQFLIVTPWDRLDQRIWKARPA